MNQQVQERVDTVLEFARTLKVSLPSARRLVGSGLVRSINVGARILIPRSETERVLREGVGKRRGRKSEEVTAR